MNMPLTSRRSRPAFLPRNADFSPQEGQTPASRPPHAAFTLLELLVVISIIALVAAIAVPVVNGFKPDLLAVASRQLLDDLGYARQRAISDHTTVFVVFIPSVANLGGVPTGLSAQDQQRLLQGQFVSYALYVRRQLGDQPGNPTVRYLTDWRTLPAGVAIPPQKYGVGVVYGAASTPLAITGGPTNYTTFDCATFLCRPELNNAFAYFPYVAFDYRGSLASAWPPSGEVRLPLTRANVSRPHDPTGTLLWQPPTFNEKPANAWNDPSLYNHIVIEASTGRARLERRQVQ